MRVGIIGGSGLYGLEGLTQVRSLVVETPFGAPSDPFVAGRLGPTEAIFLPRHGRGHRLLPSEINHRANIFALKVLGVEAILSIAAIGSLREDFAPGDLVLVDQFVDRTKRSAEHTFFGNGLAAHISFAHPTCAALGEQVRAAAVALIATDPAASRRVHPTATYVNMEGPAFSTLAESRLYRAWGMDVIGMTNLAEARLAREAEICYQTIGMVTDYDCWHENHAVVSVEVIIETLRRNADFAQQLMRRLLPILQVAADCPCRAALRQAIITDPAVIPAAVKQRLAPLIGKYVR